MTAATEPDRGPFACVVLMHIIGYQHITSLATVKSTSNGDGERRRKRMRSAGGARSKWSATAASIWIQCTSGSLYCFGIYSSLLGSSQGYCQPTLNTIALFKDIGGNAGLSSGFLYSSSLRVSGPLPVLAVGAALNLAGYFPIWLAVTGAIPRPPLPFMCFFMFIASNATTFFNTANVVTAARNFPENRGTVVGIMKGFLGLSGAILIQLYRTTFEGKPSYFLLILAVLPTFITLLLMTFVKVHQYTFHGDERPLLNGFSVISITVAAYLMAIIIWENIHPPKLLAHIFIFSILLLLLASPISIVIKGHWRDSLLQSAKLVHERTPLMESDNQSEAREQIEHEAVHVVYDKMPSRAFSSTYIQGNIMLPREEDYTLLQAMRTVNFWLMFLAMACGMGSGLSTVNNIGQIGHSLGYKSRETNTLVSLWSIWNFFGRFGAGYISDYFLRTKGCARPLFIAITLATMSIGHVVISSGMPGALYVGSIFVGLCYGCQWSLAPIITSEIFGLRHMGTIFNMISIASPIGSYILSVKVVGYIYDVKVGPLSDLKACTGSHCFMLSFLIMASVSLFGCVLALVLYFRTRRFYEQVILPRLQHLK